MPCCRSSSRPSVSSARSISPPVVPCFVRVLLDRGELIFVDHLRFEEQPADERALAVIDAAAGDEAQQLLALVLREVVVDVGGDQIRLM